MITIFAKNLLIAVALLVVPIAPTFAQESIPAQFAYLETYNINGLQQGPLWRSPEAVRFQILSDFAYLTTYGIENLMDDPIWRGPSSFMIARADNN